MKASEKYLPERFSAMAPGRMEADTFALVTHPTAALDEMQLQRVQLEGRQHGVVEPATQHIEQAVDGVQQPSANGEIR